MKTREELEEMGFSPEWACVIFEALACARLVVHHPGCEVAFGPPSSPLFTPGHEPPSKEGRELLRVIAETPEHKLIPRGLGRHHDDLIRTPLYAYRDSLAPKPPEFEGWKRNGEIYTKGNNATVRPDDNRYAWQVDHERDIYCGCRDTLPEAIKVANEMMRMFEPDPNPNPWHKTDGMAPPKEAGDRVIETVDARGNRCPAHAHSAFHCWGDEPSPELRPTKWRYADGGQ